MSTCCRIIYILSFNNISYLSYRARHSIETALLKVQNDLLLNMDRGHVTLLVVLDLSSDFDTIDHSILLSRLQYKSEFDGLVLSWFKSYSTERSFKYLWMMCCLILSIRNGMFLKVLGWAHCSLKLLVVISLMSMFMLMILSFTFRFLQMVLMSN